ncbi:MAG TPA: hypothetical protein VGG89_09065 [Candidatus Baltobacteraceae bacterium]|jgi:hypothetical protein
MEANDEPAHGEGHDFLAVYNVGRDFGKLVAVSPTQTHAMMAHHTNEGMPPDHLLFASDFMAGAGAIFDVSDPRNPRLTDSFAGASGYTHAHSFAALSNGHTLATYQIKGWDGDEPGALVELDRHGRSVRASDASVPGLDPNIRPYGLLVLENIDRVVTTSAPMPPLDIKAPTQVIQIWRLSDLKLLETLKLPKPPHYDAAAQEPDDAAVLEDGKTVMIKTGHCGLFTLTDLTAERAQLHFVYDFGERGCSGVPVVAGHYWVQPLFSGHAIAALDVKDPAHPTEVSHLYLGPDAYPHWLSREPGTGNIVITGFGSLLKQIHFASIDLETGSLTLDPRLIDLQHCTWPDGWTGAVIPHAAVFYQ